MTCYDYFRILWRTGTAKGQHIGCPSKNELDHRYGIDGALIHPYIYQVSSDLYLGHTTSYHRLTYSAGCCVFFSSPLAVLSSLAFGSSVLAGG